MNWTVIIQALIVAAVTALATGYVNSKIMEAHLKDLRDRIVRIETYLNGLLKEKK
jgi:hypothetical protein